MAKQASWLLLFCSLIVTSTFGQQKINILFLGNSLTYYNNLPELIKQLAAHDGVVITYRTIAFPNYALVDHWNDGQAQREIKSGAYHFVIVQQGPSSQAEGRSYLLNYGLKFDSLCDLHHAKLVSYMVWPAKARSFDFRGVFDSYKLLADSAHAVFSPAGHAWLKVWEKDPEFKLYDGDNFHPNQHGSLLAAMVLYGSIMGKQDLDFMDDSQSSTFKLSKSDFTTLIRAARETLTTLSH
jgi:hypothetical protein